MGKADPNAKWYREQLARAAAKRAEARAQRVRRPALRDDPAVFAEYHRVESRARYWRLKGMAVPEPRVRGSKVKRERPALVPIPDVPSGHELYDEARAALRGYERRELDTDMDYSARDFMQEYVLARLEGLDPVTALKPLRQRNDRDRKMLVHGLTLTSGLER